MYSEINYAKAGTIIKMSSVIAYDTMEANRLFGIHRHLSNIEKGSVIDQPCVRLAEKWLTF